MAASLGSLVVSLGLDAANFTSGLTKAEYQAQQSLRNISRQFDSMAGTIKGIGAAIGVGFGVSEIIDWAKEVTLAAEELAHLSAQTGSTVEDLSRLSNVVKVSGGSVEQFQFAIDRLAAGLNGSEELSTKTASALQFLGISTKDPARAMQEIADKLNQFADGASKAAIARDLFARGGVAFLAQLKAIATDTETVSTKTTEQAENAQRLAETFRRLGIESHALADIFLNEIAPGLEKIGRLMLEATKASGGFFTGLLVAARIDPFSNLGAQLDAAEEKLKKLKEPSKSGALFQFDLGIKDDIDKTEAQIKAIRATILAQGNALISPTNADARDLAAHPPKPDLGYVSPGAKGPVDDPTKKILEGQIKALDDSIAREKEALAARADYLRDYYSDGYLSVKDYYDKLSAAREDSLQATLGYYDKEIAAEKAYQAQATKETDKQAAANKIKEIQDKQLAAIAAVNAAEENQSRNRNRDTERYEAQLDEIRAKTAELAGDTAKAAQIRFDSQNQSFIRSLKASGSTDELQQLLAQQKQVQAQASLNDQTREFNLLLSGVDIAQQKINLLQQTGAISEIEGLQASSAAARALIDLLQQKANVLEATAKTLTGPAQAEALLGVEQLRLAIARLQTQTDQLGDKFQQIFQSAFVDNLAAAIDGTKKWSDAFKDAEKQIVSGISRIAAQNIGDALFGKSGPLGGIGSIFGQIFGGTLGGGKGATGATAADAALATLSTTTLGTEVAFGAVTTAAGAAASALSSVALSSIGSGVTSAGGGFFSDLIGNLFNGVAGAANGTNFAQGGLTLVGERGPEVVNMPRGAQVIPNDVLRSKRASKQISQTIIVNVPQGTSGPSANQIALRVGASTQRALSRDG